MSTRSIITFKSEDGILQVYKHWDGYPETTVPELQKFLKWNGHTHVHYGVYSPIDRNDDLSYTMANYCYWYKNRHFKDQMDTRKFQHTDEEIENFVKSGNTSEHTGLGILPNKVMNYKQASEEYNAEYFYVVDLDQNTIDEEVTETIWSFTNKKGTKWAKLGDKKLVTP